MEEISWTDRVRSEDMLLRVNEKRNVLHTVKRMKATWIGLFWRRNCLRKHAVEGRMEGKT